MRRANHRVLGRSIVELGARNPLPANPHLSLGSVPVVGPLADSILGNGSDGKGGGDGGNGSGGGNGGGGSVSGGGSSNGGGSGNGGNSGGVSVTIAASPTSGGGTPAPPAPVLPSPTPPGPATGNPPSSPSSQTGSSSALPAGPSNPVNSGNFLGVGNGKTISVDVGSSPSTTADILGASVPVASAMSPPFASVDSLGSSNTLQVGTATSMPTISTSSAALSGKHLSGGAIAGITIVCLFFLLALVLLGIRRRSIARRVELRKQWWFSRNASDRSACGSVGSNGEVLAGRLSARSSFATNFDQGLIFRIDPPARFSLGLVPDLPPLAEVRERNSALISTGGSVARRESLNSMLSNGSDSDAQYLIVSTSQNNMEPPTPMSVRPFSPSESFAFPKPPAPPSTVNPFFVSEPPGAVSSQSSAATLVHLSALPRAFMTDPSPTPAAVSLYPQTSTTSVTLSPFISAPNPSTDAFADSTKPEFSDIEVIRRPFTPSLDDELAVCPGDRVCIFRIFDDGWAFVEKLDDAPSERHERGLIPVDCFRKVDQSLLTFLADKRISYGSDRAIGTAL